MRKLLLTLFLINGLSPLHGDPLLESAVEAVQKVLPEGGLIKVDDPLTFLSSITLDDNCKDSFHLVDINHLCERYQFWNIHLPSVTPYYAVKTNHDNAIVATLASLGTGFDCASSAEIEQVLSLGVDPSRIIFAHPRKPTAATKLAQKAGVTLMVFDSKEELDNMLAIVPNGKFLLRIATDDHLSATPLSVKFGATLEEAFSLIDYAFSIGANVVGIAFHVGSNCTDVPSYRNALQDAALLFTYAKEKWQITFTILDIGGGWPGINDHAFIKIAEVVEHTLRLLFDRKVVVIAEPGRFFATGVVTAAVRILGKKVRKINGEKEISYYLSNGVFGLFIGSLYYQYDPEKLKREGMNFLPLKAGAIDAPLYNSIFWGPTCDSGDKIAIPPYFPEMESGDFIYSKNVGAYTYAVQTSFNQIPPSQAYYIYHQTKGEHKHD